MTGYTVVSLLPSHEKMWRMLYCAYAVFYKTIITDEMLDQVWSWLIDDNTELRGLAAVKDNKIVAIAHWRVHIRPLHAQKSAYLDDLYVKPEIRGAGLGRLLVEEVTRQAKDEGCHLLRWATAADNTTAQMLYDKIAKRTDWLIYDKSI